MSEHEKDLAFLRQCIRYDDRAERHRLEERVTKAQREERCVRRVIWLMCLLTALSVAGLAYGAVLQENFPYGESRLVFNIISTLGLASLISLVGFVGLLVPYRKELNRLREQCRRLSAELLESRLGKPRTLTGTMQETFARRVEGVSYMGDSTPSRDPRTDNKQNNLQKRKEAKPGIPRMAADRT